jgi:valyl-tRNA synthetase
MTYENLLSRVGRVESVTVLDDAAEAPAAATALLGDLRLLVPMKGIIDVDAERSRLTKQRERAVADLNKARGKLGNEKFVNNAPAAVVTQEKERAADFERTIAQLDEQLSKLTRLE